MLIVNEWLTHNDITMNMAAYAEELMVCKKLNYAKNMYKQKKKKKLEQVPKNRKIKQTENISNLVYNLSKMGNEKIHNKCYGK